VFQPKKSLLLDKIIIGESRKLQVIKEPEWAGAGPPATGALARKRQALGKCGGADNKVHSLGAETASGLARFPDRPFMVVGLFAARIKILNQASQSPLRYGVSRPDIHLQVKGKTG
jgi:hypothetical protein